MDYNDNCERIDPVVSVCVITYNSRKTVVETLDSIYSQTYPRIELIISDDCSTDETVPVCQKWLDEHKARFINSLLIVCRKNGGVAKNLNNAIQASTGEWIKTIAGDDLLLPDCVSDNIDFIQSNETQGIVFSKIRLFSTDKLGNRVLSDYYMPNKSAIMYYDLPACEQYKRILTCCFTPSNSVFQKRSLAIEYPFPEQYPYNEDDPHWLHLTKAGIKLSYFDKLTVLYRIGNSLSREGSDRFLNANHHYSKVAYFYSDRYFELLNTDQETAIELKKEFFLGDIAISLLRNHKSFFSRAVLFVFKMIVGTRKIQ